MYGFIAKLASKDIGISSIDRDDKKEKSIAVREDELLNPSDKTKKIMLKTLLRCFTKNDIWNAIIVAGEMALAGIEIKAELNDEQIEKINSELEQLRNKLKKDNEPGNYIDLARCMYRFQNIGLDFPNLDDEEIKKLQDLPEIFRTDPKWPKTHLAYIPQIASVINRNIDSLKKPGDASLVRNQLEQTIISKNGQIDSMIIGAGLLAQLDTEEAKKLLQSDAWKHCPKWTELLDYFQKLTQEQSGWHVSRLLPPMQTLIKLHQAEYSNKVCE